MDELGRLAGLPIYRKLYGKDGFIVMADRPYKHLRSDELNALLSAQVIKHPTGVPYLDNPSDLWRGVARSSTGNATTASPIMGGNVETVFRVGADGRPEAVTRLVSSPSPTSVRNAGETDLAWLRRRVDEICWSPM